MKVKIFLVVIYILCSQISHARILYVGTNQTYQNLSAAMQIALPGDTIQILESTIAGGLSFQNKSGLPNKAITIKGKVGSKTIISGGGNSIQFSDCNHIILEDLICEFQTGNGMNIDDASSINTPSKHITIRNCIFRSISATGNNDLLKLSGLDSFMIENCSFENGSPGGSGIDMVGCHYGEIHHCFFRNPGDNAIQAKGGSSHLRYYANQFFNAGNRTLNLGGSTGLQFFRPQNATSEASDIQVFSNYFEGSLAPIAFVGCRGVEVFHNTIVRPTKWAMRILQETVDPSRFLPCGENAFFNNIVVIESNVSTEVNIGPNTDPNSFSFDHNLWYKINSTNWSGPALPTPDRFQIIGNPMIIANSLYKLESRSPAFKAGKSYSFPLLKDVDGKIFQNPPTIGAYEIQTNVNTPTIEADKFYIYPNPCVDYIFTNSKRYNQCEYKLIDQFGKIILQGVLQENKLNVSALPKGVYILQCTLADKTQHSFSIFKI